jgi:hypothetical protein
MHYGTYEITETNRHWTLGDPEEVRAVMSRPERLFVLEMGEEFRVRN